MRRSAATVVLHSLLPLGGCLVLIPFSLHFLFYLLFFAVYLLIYGHLSSPDDGAFLSYFSSSPASLYALTAAAALPLLALALAYNWSLDNWSGHPFVSRLAPYAAAGSWRNVAGNINTEFRRYCFAILLIM